ncbi:hypothetical protein GBAR_LOCUS395 [Geodia barretti]|uniref:Uncharacterized protein n=1 Tax=Geodia barretti TaxID=519541 RepID=A0AA35QS94_GEOBA|nr:hypothetical protein GBAR_LOCUS395 [Geodia barretti]
MHYSVSYQCSLECDAGTVNVAALSWPSGEQSGDTMWDNGSWWRRGEGGEVKVWTCDNGELQHSFSLYTAVQSDILHLPPSISPPFGCLLLIIPSPCISHHTSPV